MNVFEKTKIGKFEHENRTMAQNYDQYNCLKLSAETYADGSHTMLDKFLIHSFISDAGDELSKKINHDIAEYAKKLEPKALLKQLIKKRVTDELPGFCDWELFDKLFTTDSTKRTEILDQWGSPKFKELVKDYIDILNGTF